jgi:hypothetical protein
MHSVIASATVPRQWPANGGPKHLPRAVAGLWRVLVVMHNGKVASLKSFGEKEGSRCRQSWAERREGNREARLGVFQETPGKAKES